MFERIFIEKDALTHPQTKAVLSRFKNIPVKEIDKVEEVFGKVKKPYLQKRESLNLFLGVKKGNLVKVAPPAYGLSGDPHFYFIHAYNCIYECNYCYLQGYFHSPDIVLFVNHDEVASEIRRVAKESLEKDPNCSPWFHAGEFSDSLALSHITGELPFYFDVFKDIPQARMELRTKSANVKELLRLPPLPNVITSISLSPKDKIERNDLKTAPYNARLKAIKSLNEHGHPVGLHFDPIIYDHDFKDKYKVLLQDLVKVLPPEDLEYISLGVVRFTKDVFNQVKINYPDSELLAEELIKSDDGKVRYPRPMRYWILQTVKQLCLDVGISEEKIYLCMED